MKFKNNFYEIGRRLRMHRKPRKKIEEGSVMRKNADGSSNILKGCLFAFFVLLTLAFQASADAFTLSVVDEKGNPVRGFRWLVEEDTTNVVTPGTVSARTLGVNIHGTYAPVTLKGHSNTNAATINVS